LWAGSYRFDPKEKPMPFTFTVGDQLYGALLIKKSWTVPFELRLDEFVFERHPGVSMARNYESRVTRIEASEPDKALEIKMNEPMRHAGYTFFQESFGPSGSQPGDEMFSQFAVANNPADQWPLWALIINGIGLGIHFVIMLVNFTTRSRNKQAHAAIS
ncbi:MAG: cytochrome c biogenesis protein ResB, partial [Verrucomicrobiales bacterium]